MTKTREEIKLEKKYFFKLKSVCQKQVLLDIKSKCFFKFRTLEKCYQKINIKSKKSSKERELIKKFQNRIWLNTTLKNFDLYVNCLRFRNYSYKKRWYNQLKFQYSKNNKNKIIINQFNQFHSKKKYFLNLYKFYNLRVTATEYRKKKLFLNILKIILNRKFNTTLKIKKKIYKFLLLKFKSNQSSSEKLYCTFLIKRSLNIWTRKSTQQKIIANKFLIASAHHRSESLKTSLYKLIKHTIKKQTSNQMKINLKIHNNHNIQTFFFKKWKNCSKSRLNFKNNLKKSEIYNKIFVIKFMFEQWQRTIIKKKQTLLKTDLAKISYDSKLLQSTFTSLYEFTKFKTKKRRLYFEFQTKRVLKIKTFFFEKWLKRDLKISLMSLDSRVFEEQTHQTVMAKVINSFIYHF